MVVVVTRPGRSSNVDPHCNWTLACAICGQVFADEGTLGSIELHFDISEGHDPGDIRLDTVWTGDGPAPTGKTNRWQRRHGAKKPTSSRIRIRRRR